MAKIPSDLVNLEVPQWAVDTRKLRMGWVFGWVDSRTILVQKLVQESLEAAVDILHNMQRIRKNVKAKKIFTAPTCP